MSRRTSGHNQYTCRNLARVPTAELDLMAQVQKLHHIRCGQVWGTGCRAWVQPPQYSHGTHGMLTESEPEMPWPTTPGPYCPPEVLAQFAASGNVNMRQLAAWHYNCPPGSLAQLAVDPRMGVRRAVASNIQCPSAVLQQLATDPAWEVRVTLAGNAKCPPQVLVHLLADDLPEVRIVARFNDSLPDEYKALIALHK